MKKVTYTGSSKILIRLCEAVNDLIDGGIGSISVGDLTDVDLNNLSDGQILKYDEAEDTWVNADESGGTDVEANPTGTPTDTLNTIEIDGTIYEIVGGGGGGSGYTATLLYDCQGSPSLSQVTLSDSWKNYDALYIEGMFNGEGYFGNTKTRETLQQAADNNMYVGFLSFANTYIGLNRLSNDGVTLSFYGQNTNGVTRIFGLKYGSGGGSGGSSYAETELWSGSTDLFTNRVLTISDDYTKYDAIRFEYYSYVGWNQYYDKTIAKNTLQTSAFSISDFFMWSNAGVAITGEFTANNELTTTFRQAQGFTNLYLTKIIGIKYGSGGGGGQSGDVETLFTSSSFVSTINLTKDLFDYDLITLEVSDGNGYTRGISFAPSELSLNQIIGFDNTYGYIWNSITSGTVLTNVSQYNFFIASVVGMKMGAGGTGGASAVSDLTDVDLTNLSNGQVLKYNSTTQKWENANESGGTTLPFDVVINSTDNGIDLVFD